MPQRTLQRTLKERMKNRHPRKKRAGKAPKKGDVSLRKCIVSGQTRPREEMIRFVTGPLGELAPDLDEKLPGRGIWLSAARDMLNTALDKDLFTRAARRKVKIPADLADKLEGLMVRRGLNFLGLARRAGCVVAGYEKTVAWLGEGKTGVLLQALDGAPGGRKKMRALAGGLPMVDAFTAQELGHALGRDNAVHVMVAGGPLAESLIREAGRLTAFRGPRR